MSLKAELETWAAALKAYDEEDFEQSLELFSVRLRLFFPFGVSSHIPSQSIADSSKILTNMGLIYATLGEHETAVEQFLAATRLDNYLAVASVILTPYPLLFFSS
jgi:neutrophil cytosolic factor 2